MHVNTVAAQPAYTVSITASSQRCGDRETVVVLPLRLWSKRLSRSPKTYRIYSFDLAHHAVTADFISAADDAEAIAAAHAAGFGHKCELWQERRLVAQLEAERRQA